MTCPVTAPGSDQECRRPEGHQFGHVWHGEEIEGEE